jgi:hypothetical protein
MVCVGKKIMQHGCSSAAVCQDCDADSSGIFPSINNVVAGQHGGKFDARVSAMGHRKHAKKIYMAKNYYDINQLP